MPVPRAENMMQMLKTNTNVIKRQLDGLTNADLLLQPDMRGNCANWVLGHLVDNRGSIIKHLTGEHYWSEDKQEMYMFGSEPISNGDAPHLSMQDLLADFDASGKVILDLLADITDEQLDAAKGDNSTINKSIHFLIWHESYHTGQFEYLRQLTGVNDKVI